MNTYSPIINFHSLIVANGILKINLSASHCCWRWCYWISHCSLIKRQMYFLTSFCVIRPMWMHFSEQEIWGNKMEQCLMNIFSTSSFRAVCPPELLFTLPLLQIKYIHKMVHSFMWTLRLPHTDTQTGSHSTAPGISQEAEHEAS